MTKYKPLEHSLYSRLGEKSFTSRLSSIVIDYPLVLSIIALLIFGLFILYSASGPSFSMMIRQSIYILLGIFVMFILAQFKVKSYEAFSMHLIWFALMLLIIVLVYPAEGFKTDRWIDLGFITFQPSEIVRLILPLSIASFLTRKQLKVSKKDWIVALFITAACSYLILIQPDLGTALIICIAGLLPIFLAGFPLVYLTSIFIGFLLFSPIIWGALKEYQQQRILTLFNPEADPLGTGWNIAQSKTAIGSGGFFGKGYLQGTQSQLDFIPESHSDFIFAVIGEEFGFLGISIFILAYFIILIRCLKIALNTNSNFGKIVSSSFAFIFIVYLLTNILMVVGIIPVVGVPLPLISQGGTSIIIHLIAFGVILSIKKSSYAHY